MKPKEFELKVIQVIKAIRILKNEKQLNVARALGMTDSNYCKIECGEKAITIDQLRLVADYLNTTYIQILIIADSKQNNKFELNPLSKILVEYVMSLSERNDSIGFNKEELKFLISKIREHYNKN